MRSPAAALLLASDAGSYVNRAVLVVDGGCMLCEHLVTADGSGWRA